MESKQVFITKERSASEKIRDYALIAVSIISIGMWFHYSGRVETLSTKFDTAMAYDAATQNKLSKIEGQCPASLNMALVVHEIKQEARREMQKRGIFSHQPNEGEF